MFSNTIHIYGDEVRMESIAEDADRDRGWIKGFRLIGPKPYSGHIHGTASSDGHPVAFCFPKVVDSVAEPADVPCSVRPQGELGEQFMVMWFVK